MTEYSSDTHCAYLLLNHHSSDINIYSHRVKWRPGCSQGVFYFQKCDIKGTEAKYNEKVLFGL